MPAEYSLHHTAMCAVGKCCRSGGNKAEAKTRSPRLSRDTTRMLCGLSRCPSSAAILPCPRRCKDTSSILSGSGSPELTPASTRRRVRVHSAVARNQTIRDESSLSRWRGPVVRHRTSPVSVLHIDTERGWRGGERQVLWLAQSLARSGNECVIAARPGEPLALRAADLGLRVLPCSPHWEFDPVAAVML